MGELNIDKDEAKELLEAMPIDYSFKNITSLSDMKQDKPRGVRVGRAPNRGKQKKFLTKAIWLGNNNLTNIDQIDKFVESVLEVPEALGWIDFSFNQIKDIDDALLNFPNLTILYFHGNAIDDLYTVFKLVHLKKLKRLTCHGNPIAEEPGYRNYIIHLIPQLVSLDFSPVSKMEKNSPVPPGSRKKYPDLFRMCD